MKLSNFYVTKYKMNIWILLIIILLVALLGMTRRQFGGHPHSPRKFSKNQEGGYGGKFPLGYSNIPYDDLPVDKQLLRTYWGPYLWGWKDRPFYEYGPYTQSPYPYQFECDDFARQMCNKSCNNLCYKNYFLKCSAGAALVDPETNVGQCHSEDT